MQTSLARSSFTQPKLQPSRKVFFDLFDGAADESQLQSAALFLSEELAHAADLDSDLPDDMAALQAWMQSNVESVGQQYRRYLEERQNGGARRYFRNKSHALYFLKSVAPTKMVDGAWLYGLLGRWQDARFASLIQTYLEELGEGLPSKNHVALYQRLLATQGIEHWDDLSDEHYVQGALQVALAYNAEQFLPEIIGFNLGYEQLPLHLLITAYELKELGIDPYYFTLHITVDNADSGHAKKAVESISATLPHLGDSDEWYRRVRNGYNLNFAGMGTNAAIEAFDLEREMTTIFSRKGIIGQYAHSDYRRVANRTLNDWLSDSDQTSALVSAMEDEGWFKRHQDPQHSRFWKLIQGEKARMFGVFSAYEQQVIYDWIAGDAPNPDAFDARFAPRSRSLLSPKTKRQWQHAAQDQAAAKESSEDEFQSEIRALEADLARSGNATKKMDKLIALMSPALHHTAPGLMATRLFNEIVS